MIFLGDMNIVMGVIGDGLSSLFCTIDNLNLEVWVLIKVIAYSCNLNSKIIKWDN